MKKISLVATCLLYVLMAPAQLHEYIHGMIVFENHDTLHTLIRNDAPELNATRIFIRTPGGRSKKFKTDQVLSFQRGTESFIRVTIDSLRNQPVYRMMMVICAGRYRLLRYEKSNSVGGFDAFGSGFPSETRYYLLTDYGFLIPIMKNNYDEVLKSFYGDKISPYREYQFSEIEEDIKRLEFN